MQFTNKIQGKCNAYFSNVLTTACVWQREEVNVVFNSPCADNLQLIKIYKSHVKDNHIEYIWDDLVYLLIFIIQCG